jgi:hypothetical protein
MLLKVEALKAGMLLVYENNSNVGGSIIRDIDVEKFSVTVGRRSLIHNQTERFFWKTLW